MNIKISNYIDDYLKYMMSNSDSVVLSTPNIENDMRLYINRKYERNYLVSTVTRSWRRFKSLTNKYQIVEHYIQHVDSFKRYLIKRL